jgi:2-polyprenyl-6-hydroxyphenyl methylase/3-demethylubiquinone-9 3-methyltransferase
MTTHQIEIARGERFKFGRNWSNFLRTLNDQRIAKAEESLRRMLGVTDLHNKSFLDIGSGSGLFSLAARRLGARVVSLDFDPQSVACTQALKERFFGDDSQWTIHEGSVLDRTLMQSIGRFDVVYSWGVLHHTGKMWEAIQRATEAVGPTGIMYLALYNDEGVRSRIWHWIKKSYNRLPLALRIPYAIFVGGLWEARTFLVSLAKLEPLEYFRVWFRPGGSSPRGMSRWHDLVDWIGGYPFEVASPGEVLACCRKFGFELVRLVTTRGLGCNEYLFEKVEPQSAHTGEP